MSDLRVHIEELLIDGFGAGSEDRIREAVSRELQKLHAARGTKVAESIDVPALDGGTFDGIDDAGTRIAQTIHGGLKP